MNITVLDEVFIFRREDSKTNRCISIPVSKDFESLEFICSYGPKILEDENEARREIEEGLRKYIPAEFQNQYGIWQKYLPVLNLITLSLDREEHYIGCAHRHAPEQRHIISRRFSSPGFFRTPAEAGTWRAVLNVHAVVSPEVRYHLLVRGHDSV